MKVKYLLLIICSVLMLGSSMTAYAQPKTMPDGTVFDAEFYANTYPDVKAAFGNDEKALYNHYITYGKAEGRLGVAPQNTTQNSPAKTDGSIKAQVSALGITYDPSRDNTFKSTFFPLHPVAENWQDFEYVDMGNGSFRSFEAEQWNKTRGFVRADYTNDPLYLVFAQEMVSRHNTYVQMIKNGETDIVKLSNTNVKFYDGYIGDVYFGDLDREYLLNLTSNFYLDYMESILGTDLPLLQTNSIIDFSHFVPNKYKQFYPFKIRIILYVNPSLDHSTHTR